MVPSCGHRLRQADSKAHREPIVGGIVGRGEMRGPPGEASSAGPWGGVGAEAEKTKRRPSHKALNFTINHQLQLNLGTELLNGANTVQVHRESIFADRFNVLCHFLTLSPIRKE